MGDQITNFFLVRVEFDSVNEDTGKVKKIKTQYLVDSMTCTEAEARTHKYLDGTGIIIIKLVRKKTQKWVFFFLILIFFR